ncbi:hypothetical protein EJ08DRAFT_689954 [Tothia fuscella]|uniref:ABM domain-containing protein n=1 Tax=Tothia fuscella TaxID=1048955 RepID=A0A9P4TUV0_9PEZI|nr:hypothetical protein EJ08DRAFT_689954 [Tothia fuscella]
MSGPFIVARLSTSSEEHREECIRRLTSASKYAQDKEPGVLKYACLVPRDQPDDQSVWAIEQYADKASFDSHMATPHVQDMISWMGTGSVLTEAPIIYQLESIPDLSFSRAQVTTHSDPYIIVGEIGYKPDQIPTSIPHWAAVVNTTKDDEPGALVYGIYKSVGDPNQLYSVEAYESKEFLWDVHVKSKAIEESVKNTKHLRTGLKHNFLKLEAGYLFKDGEKASQQQT